MDVKQEVNQLMHQYKTDDPFELAQLKNIHIMYANLDSKLGNYLKYRRSRFIIIDSTCTLTNILFFICTHELDHAILYSRR